jgi:hypothetical protein
VRLTIMTRRKRKGISQSHWVPVMVLFPVLSLVFVDRRGG